MSTQTFMFGSGLSFLVSFIGLLIYFRISSSLAVVDISSRTMVKSVRRMDALYGGIVGLGGLTLVHSFMSAQAGEFGLALAESVLLLGISVLLYGIWLYRDANYAIFQAKRISKKRMIKEKPLNMIPPFRCYSAPIQVVESPFQTTPALRAPLLDPGQENSTT